MHENWPLGGDDCLYLYILYFPACNQVNIKRIIGRFFFFVVVDGNFGNIKSYEH